MIYNAWGEVAQGQLLSNSYFEKQHNFEYYIIMNIEVVCKSLGSWIISRPYNEDLHILLSYGDYQDHHRYFLTVYISLQRQ